MTSTCDSARPRVFWQEGGFGFAMLLFGIGAIATVIFPFLVFFNWIMDWHLGNWGAIYGISLLIAAGILLLMHLNDCNRQHLYDKAHGRRTVIEQWANRPVTKASMWCWRLGLLVALNSAYAAILWIITVLKHDVSSYTTLWLWSWLFTLPSGAIIFFLIRRRKQHTQR